MSQPTLSILIPGIPQRPALAYPAGVASHLIIQARAWPDVEVLYLLDNRKRSIGLKRQALLDIARGEYVVYVDDDDEVADGFVDQILGGINFVTDSRPDVISIWANAYLEQDPVRVVRMSMAYDNEQMGAFGCKRKPWMCCAWRRALATTSRFPDCSYGEDAVWLAPLWKLAKTECIIEEPLYTYRHSKLTSAATGGGA